MGRLILLLSIDYWTVSPAEILVCRSHEMDKFGYGLSTTLEIPSPLEAGSVRGFVVLPELRLTVEDEQSKKLIVLFRRLVQTCLFI